MTFRGLSITSDNGRTHCQLVDLAFESNPAPGDVTVAVAYSTLNYKDALAITGRAPVVRRFPMVPGIDLAGEVRASDDPRYKLGEQVLLNGWGVGESHWGGLAQQARVRADWLQAIPAPLTARQAMALGTAGYTAALCVLALQRHGVQPASGEVLVTGATGGVGVVAVLLLARLGYHVVAATGKAEQAPTLQRLGAAEVVPRAALTEPGKPLQKERWAGVVDTLGSHALANACASTRYGGVVAACGLAQGMDLTGSVAPFILRGVTLAGVDSVQAPMVQRQRAWQLLAEHVVWDTLEPLITEVALEQAPAVAQQLMRGEHSGRTVVNVNR
jgi:acrylyl-CoA reductase (NADPH)